MLTDRGRFALALGGGAYLAAWAFGSLPLYPVAIGLLLAVLGGAAWIWLVGKPVAVRRRLRAGAHVAGDDLPVDLELELSGRLTPASLVVTERVERIGAVEVALRRKAGVLRGRYVLARVPRGRYALEGTEVVVEDPFSLERVERVVDAPDALLVYPRLVELERLFSESGARTADGRRLLLRRPSGFDLHSVREYEQGESLRRVHWPSTAKHGRLMVKDLEDSPRDEVLVVLDADAAYATGTPPDASFEVAVGAAGSILRAHAARGRRAGLLVNAAEPRRQSVHTLDGDWELALELLASVEPDGHAPLAGLLVEGAGGPSSALELCVVTSGLAPRLVDRLLQRSVTRRATSLVYVDPTSFAANGVAAQPPPDVRVQLSRLDHAGIPVCVLRRGDDLAAALGPARLAAEEAAVVG